MASQPRTHHDYTVAWVCTLPKEQTAAIAMLDQRHPMLHRSLKDDNSYILGSIGGLNIAIACLPVGKTGLISAATVTAHMIHTFPAIKFGLIVGIGSGIPPRVRLGDVVVGTPTGQFPGVVQWDFGKDEKSGIFNRTGSLNNPPRLLLGALTELQSDNALGESKLQSYLDEMASSYPDLASKYSRSEKLQDVLFKAGYEHIEAAPGSVSVYLLKGNDNGNKEREEGDRGDKENGEEGDGEEEESCQHCDNSQAVRRKFRDMRVHYGLIASGSRVIKNADVRDRIRQGIGKDTLCIETEAAGMMDNFPCLVIRGICNYADSHNYRVWEEHAAAVSAAFAKELLGYVQPCEVHKEKRAQGTFDHDTLANENVAYAI